MAGLRLRTLQKWRLSAGHEPPPPPPTHKAKLEHEMKCTPNVKM